MYANIFDHCIYEYKCAVQVVIVCLFIWVNRVRAKKKKTKPHSLHMYIYLVNKADSDSDAYLLNKLMFHKLLPAPSTPRTMYLKSFE